MYVLRRGALARQLPVAHSSKGDSMNPAIRRNDLSLTPAINDLANAYGVRTESSPDYYSPHYSFSVTGVHAFSHALLALRPAGAEAVKMADALRSIRDIAAFDPNGVTYYAKAENALADFERRSAVSRSKAGDAPA